MRVLTRTVLLALCLVVAAFATVIVASESGEVVVLRTFDSSGKGYETRLWVIEDQGRLWLRAGDPDSRWLQRLKVDPEVQLERSGEMRACWAVPVDKPDVRAWLNARLAAKYGWADRLVALLSDRSAAVPVRIEPREE